MTTSDQNNLAFLMSLSPTGLKAWYIQASDDDIAYAEELMAEAHLMAIDARVVQMQQFKEANKVLDNFRI